MEIDFGRPCGTHFEWERGPGIEMPAIVGLSLAGHQWAKIQQSQNNI